MLDAHRGRRFRWFIVTRLTSVVTMQRRTKPWESRGSGAGRGSPRRANRRVFYRNSILDHRHTLILRKTEILRCDGTHSTFKNTHCHWYQSRAGLGTAAILSSQSRRLDFKKNKNNNISSIRKEKCYVYLGIVILTVWVIDVFLIVFGQ